MLSVEQALEIVAVATGSPRARIETVPLAQAHRRVLAADVEMDHDVPPFRRAMMDGYAVRAAEAVEGARLVVSGTVVAGESPAARPSAGEAVRVMTGAPVPDESDAVLPFESAREADGVVEVGRSVKPGLHVSPRGEHARRGQVVLPRGSLLTPAALGVLATAGCAEVAVAVRPAVAVLGTGTELVPVSATPGPARIRNSNGVTLLAQAESAGGRATDLGIVADDERALRAAIRGGLGADLLLVSGGVSRGDLDLVPAALEAEGVKPLFHRWAVQPGGPLWFGVRGDTLVFGLPGNPTASFVGFELLGVPALRARLGRPFAARATRKARYAGPWTGPPDRRRFRPVRLESGDDGVLWARAAPWKGSSDPFGLAAGDALVAIPEHSSPPASGTALLDVIPLGDGS